MGNDWKYNCIGCGHQVTADVGFKGNCPACGGSRWLCHWVKPGFVANQDSSKDSAGDKGMTLSDTPKACNKIRGGITTRVEGFVTKVHIAKQANQAKKEGIGRPHADISVERAKVLAERGMTLRDIASRLGVSHTTVARILAGQKALPI